MMIKKRSIFFPIILCLIFTNSYSADGDYAVSKIPLNLLKNADVVKRFEETRFEVLDIGKSRLYRKIALTILNEKADKFAVFTEDYDKLHSIESIEGRLYDETGKKIKSLKKSDIEDLSGTSNISLADDNRIKRHSFHHKVYPYTIEYETEVKYNYTLFYPSWIPLEDEFYAVEYSKMSIVCPKNMSFRYKALNYAGTPVISTEKNDKIYTWEIKNFAAIEDEPASSSLYEIIPVVLMGPDQFKLENYEGNMSSWKEFGKFVYALKKDRDQLPDNIKQTVHQLTDGITNPKKKIEILYDFLQKNTRYISVQLGIGGWQPFDANYVAANRYGDCKALANYMYSLLKEAGIKSLYTLVKAGDNSRYLVNDFPSSQFNHVILSVPLQKDTVWLECTSQTLPAGYLSAFTSDRLVLAIDENGGTLVHTPKYGLKENLQTRKTIASIDDDGNLTANIVTVYKASQQDDLHNVITGLSWDKVMEYLKEEIDLPNYDVIKFNYEEERSAIPAITETLKLSANNYAQVSGSRLFINPNILSKTHIKLSANSSRIYDVDLSTEYRIIDSVEINIPAGYQPESIPGDVKIESKFGKYNSFVKLKDDKIIYYRKMERYSGRFPAVVYNELVSFYDKVYHADYNKIVLVKKE